MERSDLVQKLENLKQMAQAHRNDAIAFSGAAQFCEALIAEMDKAAADARVPAGAPSQSEASAVIQFPNATVTAPAAVAPEVSQ